jgi:hypothetical protein
MRDLENDLNELYQLLEQEISRYQQLIEVLKKESEYLREDSTDSLMKTVKEIEYHTEMILSLEDTIKKWIGKILSRFGKEEVEQTFSALLLVLPSSYHRQISSYQRTLSRLKGWVKQINDRNKAFIREYLTFWADLVSMLINPVVESQSYLYHGSIGNRKSFAPLPIALNREV